MRWRPARGSVFYGGVLALSALSKGAAAQTTHPELRYDTALGLTVVGASLSVHAASEFALKDGIAPSPCRWCDRDHGRDNLNVVDARVRDALLWSRPKTADTLSYVTAILAPVSVTALNLYAARSEGASWSDVGVDALVVAEAVTISMLFNQIVKFVVGRERPFVHARSALTEDERRALANADDNLSFYSGHTSLGFAAAAAGGTVAQMRGYKLAPATWASGGVLAGGTGVLRLGADKHYFSDVLVGALMGIAFGSLVPYVFHHPTRGSAASSSAPTPTLPQAAPFGVMLAF